jgi:hypothetical protein
LFIQIACSCGHEIRVDKDISASSVRCPSCNALVEIKKAGGTKPTTEGTYTLEGEAAEKKERKPSAIPARLNCFFCGASRKCRKVLVWTALKGKNVDVRLRNDEIAKQRSFVDPIGHDLSVCTPCAKRMWRRRLIWRLFVAFGCAVLYVLFIVFIVVLKHDYSDPSSNFVDKFLLGKTLGIIAISGLVSVAAIVGSLWGLVFFSVNADRTEQAIAARFYKQIDPEAEAGLSSKQFKELQPQQIEGTPAKAGPKLPGKPYRR